MSKLLKTIVVSFFALTISSTYAKDFVKQEDSVEYHIHTENLFAYKVNDIYDKEPIKVIKYLGDEWFLASDDGSAIYYLQVDPIYKTISRVRIMYPFNEVRMGKEIKYLEDKYGQLLDSGAKYLQIEEGDLRIRISTDFDNIGKDFDKIYSIIDFIETKNQSKRKESINHIYYEKRMNRK